MKEIELQHERVKTALSNFGRYRSKSEGDEGDEGDDASNRKFLRYTPIDMTVKIKVLNKKEGEDKAFDLGVINISASGLKFFRPGSIKINRGDTLAFIVNRRKVGKVMEGSGKVVRIEEGNPGAIAITFKEVRS